MKTILMAITAAAALGVFAAPAMAAPVYLECQLTGAVEGDTPPDRAWDWKLTVNEAEGRVDWSHPNASERTAAVFTADTVRWENPGRFLSASYLIDRTTLEMTRTLSTGDGPMVSRGRCRIVQAPQRAF